MFRTVEQYIEAAFLTSKERIKYIAEKNIRKRMYNEKNKRRVKK